MQNVTHFLNIKDQRLIFCTSTQSSGVAIHYRIIIKLKTLLARGQLYFSITNLSYNEQPYNTNYIIETIIPPLALPVLGEDSLLS